MRPVLKKEATTQPSNLDVMIARQPIYNNRMGVFAYELLFRSASNISAEDNGTHASAQVLSSAILNFGLEDLTCKRNIVLNVTSEFLDSLKSLQLPSELIILDLPDNIQVDDSLISELMELKKLGFRLSVGGLDSIKALLPLLPIVDIFRVDVQRVRDHQLDKLMKVLRKYKNLALQALKIETVEQYRFYCDKGFDYLQGFFLSRPRDYVSRDLPPNKLAILNLLATVHNPNTDIETIEHLITQDVALSFKLLKLINSPFFGVSRKVDSVKQSIVLLGLSEVRRFVSLLALSNMSNEPVSMIEIALLRAKLCELLAVKAKVPESSYFTVGMFSALDLLMKQPIQTILGELPLSDEIKAAILHQDGMPGEALACSLAVENAQWQEMRFHNLSHRHIVSAFQEAIKWTDDIINSL